jgi:hypothetical protein
MSIIGLIMDIIDVKSAGETYCPLPNALYF